jgi:hypothetical protein
MCAGPLPLDCEARIASILSCLFAPYARTAACPSVRECLLRATVVPRRETRRYKFRAIRHKEACRVIRTPDLMRN